MNSLDYRVCTRCVMDTTAGGIMFDELGRCSYCTEFLRRASLNIHASPEHRQRSLEGLLGRIKRAGRRRRYDCVVGVSGGVDSSWVLASAVKLGLRPLAVHMDNGWNSELAQNNIANLVRSLGVDLHTHVINWLEYRDLMQAFFDADVIDIELLYDNAMLAVNYRQASRIGTKFMVSGSNHATEGISIPPDWCWCKLDKRNLKALARRSHVRLRTFPAIGTLQHIWLGTVRRISWVWFLDYLEYNKAEALKTLQADFGYKPYPYKHYESIFTRFYQGFILPEKFGVDKRRPHFSSLIMAGQMSRDQALEGLKAIPYANTEFLEEDKKYFMKKMGWTAEQLRDYIRRPSRPHSEFPSEKPLYEFCIKVQRRLRGT